MKKRRNTGVLGVCLISKYFCLSTFQNARPKDVQVDGPLAELEVLFDVYSFDR